MIGKILDNPKKVLVIGGAGYVGSVLVSKLLSEGYHVLIFDTLWFGNNVFRENLDFYDPDQNFIRLEGCKGDLRKKRGLEALRQMIEISDVVIHLACISNDPSFDLDPQVGRSINLDSFLNLIDILREVKKHNRRPKYFIYASSSSVYGVKEEENVTEDLFLEPLTDYSRYKMLCESALEKMLPTELLPWVIIRPATVCGWSSRLRLDLSVNILTASAYFDQKIKVFGGSQKRPNIHIDDMVDLYVKLVDRCDPQFAGEIFNAGWQNLTISEISDIVLRVVHEDAKINTGIEILPTEDNRSYHISSAKVQEWLDWRPQKTIEDAVRGLVRAFKDGKVEDPKDPVYKNIEQMKRLNLT